MPTKLTAVPAPVPHAPDCRLAAGDPEAQFDANCPGCYAELVAPWAEWARDEAAPERTDDVPTEKVVA